jgi:hypothetical protein
MQYNSNFFSFYFPVQERYIFQHNPHLDAGHNHKFKQNMIAKFSRPIAFLLLLTGGVSCSQPETKQAKHEPETSVQHKAASSKNAAFRKWTKDTIGILNATRYDTSLRKIACKLSEDSGLFVISQNYRFVYDNASLKKDDNCKHLIALLREYDELPPMNSSCSFSIVESYYPDVTGNRLYDFVYEWDHIEIKTRDEIRKYGYIRGRLNDKKVIRNNGKDSAYYQFIWNDKKLIKEKMSS